MFGIQIRGAQRLGAIDDETAEQLLTLDDPAQIQPFIDSFITQAGIKPELQKVDTVDAQGRPVTQFVEPTPNAQYVAPPPKAEVVQPGSFPDYVKRYAATHNKRVEDLTTADIEDARKRYGQADDRPQITVSTGQGSEAEAIAEAIIAGDQPPNLQGLYRYGAAVRAILARRGYDLSSAQIDWTAAQRHFATLNNPQQTRLRQAVDTAIHSLDVIDTLATQWQGGPLPVLNKANLALAKSGVYGPQWASIAQQLEGQIADVTSEIANALMGGNSPTDHALKLAATNLASNWSEKTLKDMTALARKNLQIRQNAIRNVGVIGASEVNPYVPQPAPPPAAPAPKEGTLGEVNGVPAVWKTVNGVAGWYKR
jgi:hypothetical protein